MCLFRCETSEIALSKKKKIIKLRNNEADRQIKLSDTPENFKIIFD